MLRALINSGSMRTIRSLHAYSYKFSITAKTGTTTKENLEDAARTHHPPREPLQLPKGCMRTKRHAATTSQVYSEAPCRVASVSSRSAASFSLVRQRRPRKSRNVPPAIPYVVSIAVEYGYKHLGASILASDLDAVKNSIRRRFHTTIAVASWRGYANMLRLGRIQYVGKPCAFNKVQRQYRLVEHLDQGGFGSWSCAHLMDRPLPDLHPSGWAYLLIDRYSRYS